MRQAILLTGVVILGLHWASCTERFCENDMGCGLDERCDTETGKCIKVDGGVAYPVDGSVTDPDGGDGGDGGPCTGPQDCTETNQPICDVTDEICRACATSTECGQQVPALPFCNTGTGACVGCLNSDPDCGGTTPICDDATESCRGCNNDTDCQNELTDRPACAPDRSCVGCTDSATHCSGSTPICNQASWTCEPCLNHAECDTVAGGICDYATGACIAAADIVYVNNGVTCDDNGLCDQSTPCCSIQGALDNAVTATRDTVLVSDGTYGRIDVTGTTSVWIVGEGQGVWISDSSSSAQVSISDTATLTLENVNVGDPSLAVGIGVNCLGSAFDHPAVDLYRNRIVNNGGGGVSLDDCNFRLHNNIVAGNGGGGSAFGGCRIGNLDVTAEFFHNTVANNFLGVVDPGGVFCLSSVEIRSSIIVGNTNAELDTNCVPYFSLIEDNTGGVGSDNIVGVPTFVGGGDYHLQPGSTGTDQADPATTLTLDIDGEPRVQGAGPDMGADEVQ